MNFRIFLSVAILLTCVLLTAQSTGAETITMVADEWAPFNMVPGKHPEGYMVDIAREVFKSAGIAIEYKLVPWSRALDSTRKGEYTAIIGPTKNEAPYLVFPKEELARNRLSFWVIKGNKWRFTSRSSINTISLGVIEGYDYRKWLNDYAKANRNNPNKIQFVSGTTPMELNIRKLLGGRIEALVDNEAVVRYTARQLGLQDRIELAGHDTEPAFIYIAFTPANPRSTEYARILSEGITALRKSGRLRQILVGYDLKDWKE